MFQQKIKYLSQGRIYTQLIPEKGERCKCLHSQKSAYNWSQPSAYRFPTTHEKNIYVYVYLQIYTHIPISIYLFIHIHTHIHGSQVPRCSSDSSTALKCSPGMQILCALFPHITCMSEREGCQVTIWPSDSLCHTNMSTSDTGCCLYFLEVPVFIWEINSKQRPPRQRRVLFSGRRHWRQMSWIWGKEDNIKWQALALYSLDLNDHVIRQYLKHRWLSFLFQDYALYSKRLIQMNHIKSTEQVSCAERHNPANFGFLWLKIPICWFMNVFQLFDSQNFSFCRQQAIRYVYGHKVILPPPFPLMRGNDGGVKKGKGTVGQWDIGNSPPFRSCFKKDR